MRQALPGNIRVIASLAMANIIGFLHASKFETKLGAMYPHSAIVSDDPLVRSLATDDVAYMAVPQSDGALFLIYVFTNPRENPVGKFFAPNSIPVTDITHLRPLLAVPELAADDKPFLVLSADAAAALEAVWRPIKEKQVAEQERLQKEFEASQKAKKSKNAAAKKTAKEASRKPTRTDTFSLLVDAALAQIEEVATEVQEDADVMLLPPVYESGMGLRGRFTQTVQSIFEGGIDETEAKRLIAEELSPFVDGHALTVAMATSAKDLTVGGAALAWVDVFAVRAVDDLARTLVALALGKKKLIPSRCEDQVPLLTSDDVDRARELIG